MIAGIAPIPSDNTNPQTSQTQSLGKDDFLQLLVAQLAAQDPLNPMDSQDFSAQLAQFSALEQMTNVNTNLNELKAIQVAANNNSAISLIGKTVDIPGNSFNHEIGQSDALNYSLEENAAKVTVEIFDSVGNKVKTINLGEQLAGNNQIVWDGFDNNAAIATQGTYTFSVTAENAAGTLLESKTLIGGRVTDVLFEGGKTFAIVNGEKLATDTIVRVSA